MHWRLVAAIVALLPWSALRPLGALLGVIAFDVLRIRRRHVVSSMARAQIGGVADARRMFASLGTGALEFLWLAGRPKFELNRVARVDHAERFFDARARGRGVVVATAHTGNWDVAAMACAQRTDLCVVTKRLSSRGLDAFWQSTRAARGVRLIAPEQNVLSSIRRELESGTSIALLVDQDPRRPTSVVEADFLGAPALHDTSPATIAARAGAPLVVAFCRRENDRHVVDIVEVIDPPARPSARWIAETTRHVAALLDSFVRRDPSSWLWLHRRWRGQAQLAKLERSEARTTRRGAIARAPTW